MLRGLEIFYCKFKFEDQMFFHLGSGGRGREGGGPGQGGRCEGRENACILIDDGTTESGTEGIGIRIPSTTLPRL
jgi:hypothetical protein